MSYYGDKILFKEYYTRSWKRDWSPVIVIDEELRHVKIKMNDTGGVVEALDNRGECYLVISGFYSVSENIMMGGSSDRIELTEAIVVEDGGPVLKPTT